MGTGEAGRGRDPRMTFIVRMLKYLFWLIVVSSGVAILQKIVGKMASGGTAPESPLEVPSNAANQKLVRDPVCGMHVAEGLALPLKQDGEILHFCSAECRDKYLNGNLKISASA
jgi:YHS domain-containing protein